MNQQKLTIRFVLLKAKTNKRGLCPLSCRLTLSGDRKAFSTGLFVKPKDWNPKQQKLVRVSPEQVNLDAQLKLISSKITKSFLKLQMETSEFSVDDVFQNYIGKSTQKNRKVVEYFREYLLKLDKLVGIDLKLSTWKKFYYACNQVEQFVKWKYKKDDIHLKDLNLSFLIDFEYYSKTELNQVQVTINKTIQRFRKPIRIALIEGYLNKDPFASFKPKTVLKQVVFLSNEELGRLENHEFNQPRLGIVKDLFVFCCYTGLAYREMENLKPSNIVKGFDGHDWIQIKREKTSKLISVPILPKAKAILDKYRKESGKLLPKYSNQKINSYLKEIVDILGINKRVSHHTARKTFASTVLLYNDVPMEIVSELLGHSSIGITQEYYGRVVKKSVSKNMIELAKKLNKK